jgi:hypothetical protein
MNHLLTKLFLGAGIAALLGTSTFAASGYSNIATVPFAFKAGQKQVTAGTYTLSRMTSNPIFEISSRDAGEHFLLSAPIRLSSNNYQPRLIFQCYGGQCVLSQIWMEGGEGYQLPGSVQRSVGFSPRIVSVPLKAR